MGWELAGLVCERGATREAPAPSAAGAAKARAAAGRVAQRFDVQFTTRAQVQVWQQDRTRTLYLLDVRTASEFDAAHIAASRHAPGGQLVQATDEFAGVRNARIVLIDPARVRSVMTASWLNQLGLNHVFVLEPEGEDGFADWPVEMGALAQTPLGFTPWRTVAPPDAAQLIEPGGQRTQSGQVPSEPAGTLVLDLSTSLKFRARHISGAWWAVRSRLAAARTQLGHAQHVLLTSDDGTLAHLAAPEAAALWPDANVRVIEGGNAAWFAAALPVQSGINAGNTTSALDDVWYKPYDHEHEGDYEKHARAYLDWEVALVEQIRRDPAIRFRTYRAQD